MKPNRSACCSLFNPTQRSSSSFCVLVRVTDVSPSANNCESVIPKAPQIFSGYGIVGTMFF